jgi:hypothetical protein
MRILGSALLICAHACAQANGPDRPEALAQAFVDAVNAHSMERRVDLVHPKSRACMSPETDDYFSWIFSRQLKYVIPGGKYSASVQVLSGLSKAGIGGYPVPPTHQLQINFSTGDNRSTSVVLLIVKDGPRWYEVLACPGPEAVAGARRSTIESQRQENQAQKIAAQPDSPWRADILALIKAGRRVDAIQRVAAATGEELAIARLVVDLLAAQPVASNRLFEAHSRQLATSKAESGRSTMDIDITEVERRPRASLLTIDVKTPGSSVGSSFFLLCSIRELARQRGGYRYLVKIEKPGKTTQILAGFLESRNEDPRQAGEEFRAIRTPDDVIDLQEFAPICDVMK